MGVGFTPPRLVSKGSQHLTTKDATILFVPCTVSEGIKVRVYSFSCANPAHRGNTLLTRIALFEDRV
jgi:hypothetical protein